MGKSFMFCLWPTRTCHTLISQPIHPARAPPRRWRRMSLIMCRWGVLGAFPHRQTVRSVTFFLLSFSSFGHCLNQEEEGNLFLMSSQPWWLEQDDKKKKKKEKKQKKKKSNICHFKGKRTQTKTQFYVLVKLVVFHWDVNWLWMARTQFYVKLL